MFIRFLLITGLNCPTFAAWSQPKTELQVLASEITYLLEVNRELQLSPYQIQKAKEQLRSLLMTLRNPISSSNPFHCLASGQGQFAMYSDQGERFGGVSSNFEDCQRAAETYHLFEGEAMCRFSSTVNGSVELVNGDGKTLLEALNLATCIKTLETYDTSKKSLCLQRSPHSFPVLKLTFLDNGAVRPRPFSDFDDCLTSLAPINPNQNQVIQ